MPLVLVPTPIGNLQDITLRALEVLKGCDVVACEDTRRTLKLLNHYGIKKPLMSLHEHNEVMRLGRMREMLSEGLLVALVSDAGTPGISDPGEIVVRMAIDEGFPVDVLPGPSAAITALVMSGLGTRRFTFEGFLEGRRSFKEARLRALKDREETLVFYASPHRLEEDLSMMVRLLGDRPAALVREISKIHQQVIRGTLSELLESCGSNPFRGEMVLVVSGSGCDPGGCSGERGAAGAEGWEEAAKGLLEAGLGVKEVALRINQEMGVPKNRVKELLLGLLRGNR